MNKQETKRFQRRMVASFKRIQLKEIQMWLTQILSNSLEGQLTEDLEKNLQSIQDEQKKERYRIGVNLILTLQHDGRNIDDLVEALVWKTGPGEKDLQAEWKYLNPLYGKVRRY